MKFAKGISLFLVYPAMMLGIGFYAGVESVRFFYPGEQKLPVQELPREGDFQVSQNRTATGNPRTETGNLQTSGEEWKVAGEKPGAEKNWKTGEDVTVSAFAETLCVDTEYVLEETDLDSGTVVETVCRLPDKYVGMDREAFLDAMEAYEMFPPLAEMERGFVNLEVLSFSRERVVVQMNYQYIQPSNSFYLAVRDNEVVVYLQDMKTVFINTGILLDTLPQYLQAEIMQMLWMEDEEALYDFLETYSS